MKSKIVLVLDCGATNIKAVAVNEQGVILCIKSTSNSSRPDQRLEGGLIWDIEEIWKKLVQVTNSVINEIEKENIVGITVTTFGVDGAPMYRSGEMLYPVISWMCQRTTPILDRIGQYIPLEELYKISGINNFSFNTIYKLIWLKENHPEILDQMDYFVFMPSILTHKLTGEFFTDTTMAGTSMLTDLETRNFSDEILSAIGIENKFPKLVEPGTIVGKVNQTATIETGIPKGVPIIATGHDTQFAVFGSGALENEVVLSSGTWEILMARTNSIQTEKEFMDQGVTIEFDAIPGYFNPGVQWLGSGILEWIRKLFYGEENSNIYNVMIEEAKQASKRKLDLGIDFLNENGFMSGLGIKTKRGEIYRAALEALSQKTNQNLKVLEQVGGFKAESLIVVGGGSKNVLWNKLREKELGIPIRTIEQSEITVVGAAAFALSAAAIYNSPEEAIEQFKSNRK